MSELTLKDSITGEIVTINPRLATKNQDYTFILADIEKIFIHSSDSSHTWTIPPQSSIDWPNGARIHITKNGGAGTLTVARGTGVALYAAGTNNDSDITLAASARYSTHIFKIADNVWILEEDSSVTLDAELAALAAIATTDGNFIVGDGSTWVAESGATARASLGLVIGTDVHAYTANGNTILTDAGVLSIAGLTTAADKMIYTTALDTYAVAALTAFARTLLDDTSAAAALTTLTYTANSGGVARTLNALFNDEINVLNYGILGYGATDYAATLQAIIDAFPGKTIYFPAGTYNISTALLITTDGTKLRGDGKKSIIINTSVTGHGVKFYPNDTAVGSFLDGCSMVDLCVYSSADKTAGAGVYLLQCNGFTYEDVLIENHPEGLLVSGGQLNKIVNPTIYASSSVLTGTPVSSSSAIRFCTAAMDGGAIQHCFTTEVINLQIAVSRCLVNSIVINDCDGLHFTNGYVNGAYNDELKIECLVTNGYVAGLDFTDVYLDGINMTTAPTNRNGVNIPASTFGNVYRVNWMGGTIGNYTGKGVVCGEQIKRLTFGGGVEFVNIDNWAIDITGSNTATDFICNEATFTDVGEVTTSTGAIKVDTVQNAIITDNIFTGIGNTGATAISLNGTNKNGNVDDNLFIGCTNQIADNATWTGELHGIPLAFTPAVTFATPGDLSLGAYTTQMGRCYRRGKSIHVSFAIQVVPTHTTASGSLQISGLPVGSTATTGVVWFGPLNVNGVTKAGYTSFSTRKDNNNSLLTFFASASAAGLSAITAADVPSGGTLILQGSIEYEASLA